MTCVSQDPFSNNYGVLSIACFQTPWNVPRLFCTRESLGKITGVGCHFLLQCMKVKSKREVAQSCPTPSDPMDYSLPGSSVHGIFQARVLEWGAIAFSGKQDWINTILTECSLQFGNLFT